MNDWMNEMEKRKKEWKKDKQLRYKWEKEGCMESKKAGNIYATAKSIKSINH